MSRTVEIGSPLDALRVFADDYLRWEFRPDLPCSGWVSERGAVLISTGRTRSGWLTGLGDPAEVLALLDRAKASIPKSLRGLTVPLDLAGRLPGWLCVDRQRVGEWEWMRTYAAPPQQAAENRVQWLYDADAEIAELLSQASPRHSAAPGDADILRWCGIRDDGSGARPGMLLACAAHTEHIPGVPHLASIATNPAARGLGLGSAVTAWLTRKCLAEGAPVVTLGMYADNDAARSVYQRLGYAADHGFFSATRCRP